MSRVLRIDAKKCMGHGLCYSTSPSLLEQDDEGFVAQRGQDVEVPDDLVADAEDAVDTCPEDAISLLDL